MRSRKNIENARSLRPRLFTCYNYETMKKSVHSNEYLVVRETLIAMRQAAGLTQRELADRLQREHSFVWRIETGERRLDVVEFAWVCQALNQDAASVYVQMAARWSQPD